MLIHFLGGIVSMSSAESLETAKQEVMVSYLRYVKMIDRIGQALRRILKKAYFYYLVQ